MQILSTKETRSLQQARRKAKRRQIHVDAYDRAYYRLNRGLLKIANWQQVEHQLSIIAKKINRDGFNDNDAHFINKTIGFLEAIRDGHS